MNFEGLLKYPPFALPEREKEKVLKKAVALSFRHHYLNCEPYRRLCQKRGFTKFSPEMDYKEIPFLPVEIFKRMNLLSVPESRIVQEIWSSGTHSQRPSKIYLDNITKMRQVRTLLWLLANFLGTKRLPFVILNDESEEQSGPLKAQDAAFRGFLIAASKRFYCSRKNTLGQMILNKEKLFSILKRLEKSKEPFVILGYTFALYDLVKDRDTFGDFSFSLPNVKILHFGGWKKLENQKVTKEEFINEVAQAFGVGAEQILDTYGFTEQLGVVYLDCPDGLKRCPLVSQVIVRDIRTLEVVPDGKEGLLEFITPLPYSYPGVAVLLDDIGRIVTRDQCRCKRHGAAFEVLGRAKDSELRGCGDIAAELERSIY